MPEYLIVGGGPTGIGAAHRLRELGVSDWLLVDNSACAGGLASSVVDERGFTWDMGGHVQFSHYEAFDRYMDLALGPDGWLHHQRESWIWLADRFVPYPFQNNLHRLPPGLRWRCVQGLLAATFASNQPSPENFQEWIRRTFGDGLAEVFFKPYNFKVWAHPLELLDYKWVGERVAVPALERVLKAVCLKEDDVSWGPNSTFRFPKHGGTGAVWRSLCSQLPQEHVCFSSALSHLDVRRRRAHFSNGTTVEYENLISTIPLDILVRIVEEPQLLEAAAVLKYSSTHVIGIGLNGQPPDHLRTKCWMYFPEANCPFYRVTVFSNYSPNNVAEPGKQWSLMAEVSESRFKPVDTATVVNDTVNGMVATCLIENRDQIVDIWYRRLDHGYPVPTVGRDGALAVLLPRLETQGIYSRGRFGAWKYEVSNQDHSFAQGREVIDRLLGIVDPEAGPEPTLNRPSWVNGRRNP